MSHGRRHGSVPAVAALGLALGGCVTYGDVLLDPRTQEVQTCRSTGWGIGGVRRATVERYVCLATLRTLGFRPLRLVARAEPLQAP